VFTSWSSPVLLETTSSGPVGLGSGLTHGVRFLSFPLQEISHTEYVRPDMDVYQDYTEGCLTFKNPTHHNNGNYTLIASNYLGVAAGSVYGHFLDTPFEGEAAMLTHLIPQNHHDGS